jgi:hypothetical protein
MTPQDAVEGRETVMSPPRPHGVVVVRAPDWTLADFARRGIGPTNKKIKEPSLENWRGSKSRRRR